MPLDVHFDKEDGHWKQVAEDLVGIGKQAHVLYEASYGESDEEEAELLILRPRERCGPGFLNRPTAAGSLPVAPVMDKRDMGKRDIAATFAGEIVVSDGLREILEIAGLSGWQATEIQHIEPRRDRLGEMFHLEAGSYLPPVSPMTELYTHMHGQDVPNDWKGTKAILQHGPLTYRRIDLSRILDFNGTHELFGEITIRHRLLIVSQRTRKVLHAQRLRGRIDFEPVVIV